MIHPSRGIQFFQYDIANVLMYLAIILIYLPVYLLSCHLYYQGNSFIVDRLPSCINFTAEDFRMDFLVKTV